MSDFNDILTAVGDFGLFQKLLLSALCYPDLLLSFQVYSLLLTQASFPYHCNTDWILKANPNLTTEEQLNLTIPKREDGSLESCRMMAPVDWDIEEIREHGLNETSSCTHGWVYDTSMLQTSIVSDFDLVCDKALFVGFGQSIYLAAVLVGSLLFGTLADVYGRKRATQVPLLFVAIFTMATAFAPNFWVYLVIQFLAGMSYGGSRVNSVVLAAEWLGVTKRSLSTCFTQTVGGIGQCIMTGTAYFLPRWRTAQIAMASSMLPVIIYVWWIPESARWLLSRGRTQEANDLFVMVASVNKRTIPDHIVEKIVTHKKGNPMNVKDLFASAVLRKYFFILSLAWFSNTLAYSCLSLNVGNFGLNIFLMQLIFGLSDIPSQILSIWLLEAVGRKICLLSGLIFGGCICLLSLAFSQDSLIPYVTTVTIGRVFMKLSATITAVYIQELFPTSFRQTAMGIASIACRVASILSPMVNLLVMYHSAAPTLVYGTIPVVSGCLCLLLPETRRMDLPDSTEQLEERNKNVMEEPDANDHSVSTKF